jgi:chorismate mutase
MGMTREDDRRTQEREEIVARVASFKATQEKFKREREEYFFATLESARHNEKSRRVLKIPPFWS